MGTVHLETFTELQSRIRQFVEMYEKERTINELLSKEKAGLREKIRLEQNRIKDLEEKYNKLKISKALVASGEDVHDAKLKVNKMVREIDRCIALLNR